MAETDIPPLYDEERGLRELARHRLKRDALTRVRGRQYPRLRGGADGHGWPGVA